MNSKWILSITLIYMLFFLSCSDFNRTDYQYDVELFKYLQNEHKIARSDLNNKMLYIIDVEGCACAENTLESLASANRNLDLFIVIIGTSSKYSKLKNEIEQVGDILEDRNKQIYRYETGLSKPLFFNFKNDVLEEFVYVKDNLIPLVLVKLNTKR